MSNGAMHVIPYNPATDRWAYVAQGLQNMLGPMLQREQQRIEQQKMQQDLGAMLQYAQQMQQQPGAMPTGGVGALGQFVTQAKAPQFPTLRTPQMQQAAASGIMGRMFPAPMTPLQASQIRVNLARAEALTTDKSKTAELMREGYTQGEAKHILDIFHGLQPRASAGTKLENKSLPEQLSFWQTVYNKTLDPVWGYQQPTADMEAARGLAKQNIDRIIKSMRTERGLPTTMTPPSEPWQLQGMPTPEMLAGTLPGGYIPEKPARELPPAEQRLTEAQIVTKISKMKFDNKFISASKANEIVRKYPTLSQYLLQLNPEEQEEVFSAITAGMTEQEILKFFK